MDVAVDFWLIASATDMRYSPGSYLLRIAILTLLYIGAGKLGLSLAFTHSSASPVWPPTGFALAALLLMGMPYAPAILIGAFVVNYTVPGARADTSLAIAVGNTLEAVLGCALTRRFASGISCFREVPGIFRFIFIAAIPSTLLSAAVGVGSLWLAGLIQQHQLVTVAVTWWTGNFVSDLVLAPLLVIWLSAPIPPLLRRRGVEAGAVLILLVATGLYVFGPWNRFDGVTYPVIFLAIPPLLWAAYRFRDRGAVTASALLSTLATVATVRGYGPFVLPNPNDSLVMLQLFIGVNAISMLVLAALVSDRSRSAGTLEENQRRLLMALEAGRMGTWDWDMATGKVNWSPTLERIHGLEPGTFGGTFEAFLADVHPGDRERIREQVGQTSQGTREHHTQYRLLLKDGTVRYVEGRGELVRDKHGKPVGMIGICIDVTKQKMGDQERERLLERERTARAEAERASQAKDNFLAVLSHELRTPLTPVLLTASMLEGDSSLPASIRSDVQMIRRNVEMEARLIDDMLDLTRITRGKLQLQFHTTDLHEIVHRAIEICFPGGVSAGVKVELGAQYTHIRADAGRIQQVLWNLLNNARKFTPSDGTITVRSGNSDERSVWVEVSDTGVGIQPEAIPKLFQAFEQGDSLAAKRAGGLGLGLAISRALMVGHGGTLTATSEGIGKGATFRVQFATVAAPVPENGKNQQSSAPRRARILLVEDNDMTLQVLRRLLVAREHHVLEATTIAKARELAARERVDLVISDLGLPDGMGHEMMSELSRLYGVRGIAISGYGMPQDIDQSRQAGFVEHLVKPVDAVALEAAISRVLGNGNTVPG